MLKIDSRKRSAVGLIVVPGIEYSFLPFKFPPIILKPVSFLYAYSLYLALENQVIWAMPAQHFVGQNSPALPKKLLEEFEVN